MTLIDADREILSRLTKASERSFQINVDFSKSGRSTIIWLVGISGFVLANSKPYWEGVLGEGFFVLNTLNYLLVYALPLSMLVLAFGTMKLMEEWMGIYTRYYIAYAGALDLYSLKDESFSPREIVALLRLDSEKESDLLEAQKTVLPKERAPVISELVKLRRILNRYTKRSNFLYRITMRLFYFQLFWIFVAPFVITVPKT